MSIFNKFKPDKLDDVNNKLSDKNDKLFIKFKQRRKYWDDLYKKSVLNLYSINLNSPLAPKLINEMEGNILMNYERINNEIKKMIVNYNSTLIKRNKIHEEAELFYEIRKDTLNLPKSNYIISNLENGIIIHYSHTCKLYEVFIDYLSVIKDLLRDLKHKIKKRKMINDIKYI